MGVAFHFIHVIHLYQLDEACVWTVTSTSSLYSFLVTTLSHTASSLCCAEDRWE